MRTIWLDSYDDLECQAMFDCLMEHSYIIGTQMFLEGMKYQKMLEESIV